MSSTTEVENNNANLELELHRTTILNPLELNTSVQREIQDNINPEVMEDSLKYCSGINVMGGGLSPMLLSGKITAIEGTSSNNPEVLKILENEGINNSDNYEEIINNLCEEENKKEQEIRLLERNVIRDLGANRIRLHFDETMTHLSLVENLFDEEGNIKESEKDSEQYLGFMQLVTYVQDLERDGIKVEITLGPGVPHPEHDSGKRYMYSVTEYELPIEEADKKIWEKYCKGIVRNFPNADLTVWIEPNYEAFVKSGRDVGKYAETVISAANAIKRINHNKRVGLNMLYLDQSFAFGTLDEIKNKGISSTDVISYISFNPYRWHAPESPTKGSLDNLSSKKFETYEEEVKDFRKKLREKYQITDIRVGESGYEGDKYSSHQNTICNLRSWVLDRYLWVRETPWRAVQKKGSKSQRGLISEEGIPTENYYAYKHFNEIFSPEVRPLGEVTDPQDRRIYCKMFKNEQTNDVIMVLWVAQEYNTEKEIYKRTAVLNLPRNTNFTKITKLWNEEVEEEIESGNALNEKGIDLADDPVILIGKFDYQKNNS